MNENVVQGESNINQNKEINQDNHLNNQLIPILPVEGFNEKAKNIRIKFIIPIIILSILDIAIQLISCFILFESEEESDIMNPILISIFLFPISTFMSIAIVIISFELKDQQLNNIKCFVILFLIKGIFTCLYIFFLNLKALGIILNVVILVSFCAISIIYQIKLLSLKKQCLK